MWYYIKYIFMTDCHSAVKMEETLSFSTTWMNLKNISLSEVI